MSKSGRKRKNKVSLPGRAGGKVVDDETVSPYDPARRERIKRAIGVRSMEWFAENGHLDGSDNGRAARLEAWGKFSEMKRQAGLSVQAMDTSRIKVDTFTRYDGITDRKIIASRTLNEIQSKAGDQKYHLLERIHSEQYELSSLLIPYRRRKADAYKALYEDIRAALDGIVEYYGVGRGRVAHKILTSHDGE